MGEGAAERSHQKKAFRLSASEHEVYLQKVRESKAPSYALKVTVVEAQNLLAKDANGYSDPYCMLGIMLRQSPRDTEEKKERKFSFRKKKDKIEKRSSIREVLPAKYIQVTEVKSQTLNPVWNEHFQFEIDDIYNDQLHLDIWDHDDDVSVADACKKLNEVSGFKGMGRYFKQIVKSARSNGATAYTEENLDDFLGCLNISVNEIPVGDSDTWFKLEPRSSSSRVQGECHLTLKLITTQRDTILCKKTSVLNVHEILLTHLLEYEHMQLETDYYSWKGELSKEALTILSHHVMQTDLTPLQQAMIRWQAYSIHHQVQSMDYAFLLELLKVLESQWNPVLQSEQEQRLAESFNLFTDYCFLLLRTLRDTFPANNSTALTRLEFLLWCLGYIHSMQAFKKVCPFHNELHVAIITVIKKGTLEWYEKTFNSFKPEEKNELQEVRSLIRLVDAVHFDVQRCQNVYNKLFVSTVKVDFFSITYRQLEKLVADDVSVTMEELYTALEQEGSKMTQNMGETLFELYISLKELKYLREFLSLKDSKSLALSGFHEWFQTFIHKWLQIVHEKTCERIQKAVEVDKLEYVDALCKHSSSAVDVTTCFSHIKDFWLQLAWPDSAGAFMFVTRLTDDVCSATIRYSELIKCKVEKSHGLEGQTDVMQQLCIALNNIEHIRKFIENIPKNLDWKKLEAAMEQSCGSIGKQQVQKSLTSQLQNIDLDMQREAKNMSSRLTEKMVLDIKKYIQHISLSPDSIQNDDAVSPLMKYLDDKLIILSDSLVKENLNRILKSLWQLLLKLILDAVTANRGVSAEFYGRFHYTLEALVVFFHAEGQGLPLEILKNEDYKALEELLRLSRRPTNELIEKYYLDKLKQQNLKEPSKYGRLSVRCYYEASEHKLLVEVLHATDLIALDANGLSDPFVIIELCPHHSFPMVKSQRTQVKNKTLHPVYDELFQFSVAPDQCKTRAACILFTVMDHDWLSTNDFAGEAITPLHNIHGLDKPLASGGVKNVQPMVLQLTMPRHNVKPTLRMLEARTTDREAQDFVKKLKEMEKSMGEDN
ncbi:BAI1-associated protein 3 [Latimeria chalumnae]|uniref:BAI1-associated protein 3 n=1 Tax=Latimeria chalumnae TaxID=7897 RepID=UPI00313B380D